jgi:catechol 2,3-dioxygenase
MSIMRMGRIELRVMEMDKSIDYYTNVLGLELVGRSEGKAYFKAWDEWDHHSVILTEADAPGLETFGLKVASNDDLTLFEKKVEQFGLTTRRISKGARLGEGQAIQFELPTGQLCELYHDIEYVGSKVGTTNPDPWPDNLRGIAPHRLDHIAVTGEDVNNATRFFVDVLDFGQSEKIVVGENGEMEVASFLFAKHGGKPHDIAFVKGPNNKFNHVGFFVESWDKVLRSADIVTKNNVPTALTPQRHGITRGLTTYFFDPSGNCNEAFASGYITYPDFPTITWTEEMLETAFLFHNRKPAEALINAVI